MRCRPLVLTALQHQYQHRDQYQYQHQDRHQTSNKNTKISTERNDKEMDYLYLRRTIKLSGMLWEPGAVLAPASAFSFSQDQDHGLSAALANCTDGGAGGCCCC
jgi:hypothetical protein